MAWLVPEDFDLSALANDAERRVVTSLCDNLGTEWLVLPQVTTINSAWNAEIDVLLASTTKGVYLFEVKGGLISLRDGTWYAYGKRMSQNPFEQVTRAKHNLVKRLQKLNVDLSGLLMREILALPDMQTIPPDGLGVGAPRENLFGIDDLHSPEAALARLKHSSPQVPNEQFVKFIRAIRPTLRMTEEAGKFRTTSLHRIDDSTRSHLASLVNLADNRRFLVTGAAGTGKTFLAERWARRCAERGERTLLLCFNIPLSDELRSKLESTEIRVESFHKLARELLTPIGYKIPADANSDWWDNEPARLIIENLQKIVDRFDSIIIDEGQDFRPTWLTALQMLLDNAGPQRFLMVADPLQAIYGGPWNPPSDLPSTQLQYNVRSTSTVANRVRELGGVPPNPAAPEGPPVRRFVASEDSVLEILRSEINLLRTNFNVSPSQIAIVARHTALRDKLINADMPTRIDRWANRDEETIVCETIHRLKGIERVAVIVVDLDTEPSPELEYVGTSRAILHLTTIHASAT